MKTDESISCKLNNRKGSEIMCNKVNSTKIFKKFFIVAFSMVAFALLSFGCAVYAKEVRSGEYTLEYSHSGEVKWSLDDQGTLTLSGEGRMERFCEPGVIYDGAWPEEMKEQVKKVVIKEGFVNVGDSMFEECDYLTEVQLPESVKTIGDYAFFSCGELKTINLDYVTNIGEAAFMGTKVKVVANSVNNESSENSNNEEIKKPSEASEESTTVTSDKMSGTSSSLGNSSTDSSYFSKTADTIMPQTMFALAGLLMLALAGLWVSLKKQRA